MNNDQLIDSFRKVNISNFPDFDSFSTPLERGLWILLVAKESKIAQELTAEQIALIARKVYEVSIEARAITNALNRAGSKVHVNRDRLGTVYYEIMKIGKELLFAKQVTSLTLHYFEPNKKFSSKRLIATKLLDNLAGDLKIVDPYCGERTLDILHGKNRNIQFLTHLDNLKQIDKARLIRGISDFKTENPLVEFRDYKNIDIHDRYIISKDALVLLGYSISSLGGKESFAVMLDKSSNQNVVEAMIENFNRRWKSSIPI